MPSAVADLIRHGRALLTPNTSTSTLDEIPRKKDGKGDKGSHGFTTAGEGHLFPRVDPAMDGADCDHDCASCTVRLPRKWKIDEDDRLYGHVNGWATHLLVATGKTDWVRDVADEKGSVMEAIGKSSIEPKHGKLMLSASNLAPPDPHRAAYAQPARCLLLPAFTLIDGVTPANVHQLLTDIVDAAPTTTTPLGTNTPQPPPSDPPISAPDERALTPPLTTYTPAASPESLGGAGAGSPFAVRACPHDALVLLCSQGTRDARCGQSAPLLRRELERHLRARGLFRDADDERPGGVGVYFVSHVGGHKYSANVMVYRRAGCFGSGSGSGAQEGGAERAAGDAAVAADRSAAQCIWLARVRPAECEGIVRFTVLQGKVVRPERQLRGGFDRAAQACSW